MSMIDHELEPPVHGGTVRQLARFLAMTAGGALLALALVALQHEGSRPSALHTAHPATTASAAPTPHEAATQAPPIPAAAALAATPVPATKLVLVGSDAQAASLRQEWEDAERVRTQLSGGTPQDLVILVVNDAEPLGGRVFLEGYLGPNTTIVDLRPR
ncbi:MAG TPA: hypothetical protein VKV26_24940 [Dehalococcoidia bacterium]|nr:hypothetical protein [Dehalococcoidia bacterium]